MSVFHIAALGVFVVLMVAGQMLFKLAAQTTPTIISAQGILTLFRSPSMWAAVMLYGVASILWVFLLQRVPLSVAYMFVALAIALVPAGAALFFGETLGLRYIAGAALIVIGVVLVSAQA